MTYTVITKQFQGPFDLLLFFIERDEIDIYDIPIAQITDDFLDYIRQMESMNIDLASEFILVAASLMRIKARLLLPRKVLDEEGNEIDPREELVKRLLEYKRYKNVLAEMRDLEEMQAGRNTRGNVSDELQKISQKALVDTELESLTLFKLLKTFHHVLERFEEQQKKQVHTIHRYHYTVQDQKDSIVSRLINQRKLSFKQVFEDCENRIHAIIRFLAILELLNAQRITINQGSTLNSFWVTQKDQEEE